MIPDSIGGTGLVTLSKIIDPFRIFVKLEKNNRTGSIKDRPALFMINDAEKRGFLGKNKKTIVEPTSGNTGIALSAIGISRGYRVILTMPQNMSRERIELLKLYGADVVLTPDEKGMRGAIEKALEIVESKNAYMPDQFSNPANPFSHEMTTGPEILKQADYKVDAFVAAVGTGGTITGVGRALKKQLGKTVKIVAVEPLQSAVLSGNKAAAHKIQGIGAGFIPKNYDHSVVDRVITVDQEEVFEILKKIITYEGLSIGLSSAANILAALKLSVELGGKSRIATVACDGVEKYMSLI
jgi:cysteine synthase A